jgi:hypothetical protein
VEPRYASAIRKAASRRSVAVAESKTGVPTEADRSSTWAEHDCHNTDDVLNPYLEIRHGIAGTVFTLHLTRISQAQGVRLVADNIEPDRGEVDSLL